MELLNKKNIRLITAAVVTLVISGLIVMIVSLFAKPYLMTGRLIQTHLYMDSSVVLLVVLLAQSSH